MERVSDPLRRADDGRLRLRSTRRKSMDFE